MLASNEDGLAFALAPASSRSTATLLDGDTIPFVDLRLSGPPGGT